MARYRAAIIGCGAKGKDHLASLRALPDVELVACSDIDPQRLQQRAEDFGVPRRYTDYREMLEQERIGLLVVATQARQHREIVVAGAEAGVAGILCEKPMALDLAECDAMVDACERSGTRLAINHQSHCMPSMERARQMLAKGDIGELLLIRGLNKGSRKAGNELLEIGTHTFNRMLCLGGAATWAFGYLTWEGREAGAPDIMESQVMEPRDRDDGLVLGERGYAMFGFTGPSGPPGSVVGESYFLSYAPGDSPGLSAVELVGSKGQLALRSTRKPEGVLFHLSRPVACAADGAGQWREVELPPLRERLDRAGAGTASDEATTWMYVELLRAIEEGREHPCSGVAGRATIEMAMGLYESHLSRARVDLPLAEREHPLARRRRN